MLTGRLLQSLVRALNRPFRTVGIAVLALIIVLLVAVLVVLLVLIVHPKTGPEIRAFIRDRFFSCS